MSVFRIGTGPRRSWRHLAAAAGLAALAAVAAAQETGQQPAAIATVTIATAATTEVRAVVPVAGTVIPRRKVLITPEIDGLQVRQVLVDVGDPVRSGDLLVRLKRDRIEAELSEAKAEVARARSAIRQSESQISSTAAALARVESEFARMERLREGGSASQSAYDEALAAAQEARAAAQSARDGLAISEAQLAQAEAQQDVAALRLSQTEITAPVYGVVGAREAQVGALTAGASAPLLTLYENGTMELSAEVIETALADIEAGDGGIVEVAGVGPLVGLVRSVSPTVDPTTRLGEVLITLEGDPGLKSGLFGRGEIETDRHMAVTVPITALLSDATGAYVQVIDDGVVRRRDVTAGLVWQDRREIVAGLDEGEVVVARAGAFFRDGDRVRGVADETKAEP